MCLPRAVAVFVAAGALTFAYAGIAEADSVVNDVVVGSTDTVVAGGSTTVGYQIVPIAAGPDGAIDPQPGCNASDGSPATVTINKPAAVTASPSSLTFSACNVLQSVAFSSSTPGNYPITIGVSDTGPGSYLIRSGTFTLHVTGPSNTVPSVVVTGVSDGASYEIGSVPFAGCSVTDAQDGPSSSAASLSGTLFHGLGSQTATCTYTDTGGLTASASATYTIHDTGTPTIVGGVQPGTPDGSSGWYVTAPTVSFACIDSGSGVQSCTGDQVLAEGVNQSVTGTATDWAANSASATVGPLNVDLTDPANVTITGGPGDGASYHYGSVPSAPTCTADDAVSGVASCVVTGYGTTTGPHTLTATATDNAGRTMTATRSYTVLAWTISGFYQPVDMGGVLNLAKNGATIPLKFELFADSEVTDTSAIHSLTWAKVACDGSSPSDEVETYATGGTSLRYDTTAGQYVYNWQTPKGYLGCAKVTLTTQDGSATVALFKFR